MTLLNGVRMVLEVSGSLLYCVLIIRALFTLKSFEHLSRLRPAPPTVWPKLSVILPACNEAESLEASISSLLAEDYPDLEIVLVDDRSTDETPQIVDRLAARDPRVRAIHVTELPEGWLGKLNALEKGLAHSSGELVLFADADVVFSRGVLRKTVSLMQERGIDHLPAAPHLASRTVLQAAATHAFAVLLFATLRKGALDDPKSEVAIGVGAFNLFRRATYDKSPGLEWLRLEVADDVGLGLLLKKAGGKTVTVIAIEELSVVWYPSLWGMVRGLEKNMYPIAGQFNPLIAGLRALGLAVLALAPFLSSPLILAGSVGPLWLRWGCLGLTIAATVLASAWVQRDLRSGFWAGLLLPLGFLLIGFMIARSTYVCLRQGAVIWRGTSYPLAMLKKSQRVHV